MRQIAQRTHQLVLTIYLVTEHFPPEVSLGQRLRHAATEVAADLATGQGATAHTDLTRVGYYLLLAHDLGFMPPGSYTELADEIQHILNLLSEEQ